MTVGLHVIQCGFCVETRNAAHLRDLLHDGFHVRPQPPFQTTRAY